MQQNERNASRTRSPRGKGPSGRMSRWPCKDYLRGTCNDSFCKRWHPLECLLYKTKSGYRFGEKCSYAHRQVDEQPSKRSKKNDDKSSVAMLKENDLHESVWQPVVNRDESHEKSERPDIKRDTRHELKQGPVGRRSSNARQLGCVFHDMKPPKSILRKSSDMQKPIQRVKFTKGIARHTKIRDQNPSLGYISPGEPHQRSPNAPKFEDRSQEETEWQEQGSREAAWKLAKTVLKLKEQERATFFSPSENRCLPASTLKPEEREFVVDSGASMHMISKKDLSDAEMDTFDEIVQSYDSHNRQWRSADAWRGHGVCKRIGYTLDYESPRKHASSIVARKALRWKRIFLWMDQRSKTTSHLKRDSDTLQHGRSYCGSRLVKFVFRIWFINFKDTFKTGESLLNIFFKLVFITYSKWYQDSRTRWSNWKWHLSSDCVNYGWWKIVETRYWSNQEKSKNKKKEPQRERGDTLLRERRDTLYSEIPEWLQEFRENLDDEIPLQGGSHASSSHEISLEPTTKRREDLCKHSVYTHFSKNRNCEICQRTKYHKGPV